jgi:hypothetical protein
VGLLFGRLVSESFKISCPCCDQTGPAMIKRTEASVNKRFISQKQGNNPDFLKTSASVHEAIKFLVQGIFYSRKCKY